MMHLRGIGSALKISSSNDCQFKQARSSLPLSETGGSRGVNPYLLPRLAVPVLQLNETRQGEPRKEGQAERGWG